MSASLTHASTPRVIDVREFAAAREAEVIALCGGLRAQGGTRHGITVPRHLRRRATSHKPYTCKRRANIKVARLKRIKADSSDATETSTPQFTNRAMRRRPERLQASMEASCATDMTYTSTGGTTGDAAAGAATAGACLGVSDVSPADGGEAKGTAGAADRDALRHLETHIWHARRVKMHVRWGHVLAQHSAGRGLGSRSFLSNLRRGSVMHDASYWACLQLSGGQEAITQLLQSLSDPVDVMDEQYRSEVFDGAAEWSLMLYEAGGFPTRPLTPARAMWQLTGHGRSAGSMSNGSSDGSAPAVEAGGWRRCCSLWLWVHAAAFGDVWRSVAAAAEQRTLSGHSPISVVSRCPQLRRLEVAGAGSEAALRHVLQRWPGEGRGSGTVGSQLWVAVGQQPAATGAQRWVWPHNAAVGILAVDPRLKDPVRVGAMNVDATAAAATRFHHTGQPVASSITAAAGAVAAAAATVAAAGREGRGAPPQGAPDVHRAGGIADVAMAERRDDCEPALGVAGEADLWGGRRLLRELQRWPGEAGRWTSAAEPLWQTTEHGALPRPMPQSHISLLRHAARRRCLQIPLASSVPAPVVPPPAVPPGDGVAAGWGQDSGDLGSAGTASGGSTTAGAVECPVLLVRRHYGRDVDGWSLILPAHWVLPVWIALAYQGVRPAGQTEWRWLAAQCDAAFFPYDFPDTPAGQQLTALEQQEQLRHLSRRPAGRRAVQSVPWVDWGTLGSSADVATASMRNASKAALLRELQQQQQQQQQGAGQRRGRRRGDATASEQQMVEQGHGLERRQQEAPVHPQGPMDKQTELDGDCPGQGTTGRLARQQQMEEQPAEQAHALGLAQGDPTPVQDEDMGQPMLQEPAAEQQQQKQDAGGDGSELLPDAAAVEAAASAAPAVAEGCDGMCVHEKELVAPAAVVAAGVSAGAGPATDAGMTSTDEDGVLPGGKSVTAPPAPATAATAEGTLSESGHGGGTAAVHEAVQEAEAAAAPSCSGRSDDADVPCVVWPRQRWFIARSAALVGLRLHADAGANAGATPPHRPARSVEKGVRLGQLAWRPMQRTPAPAVATLPAALPAQPMVRIMVRVVGRGRCEDGARLLSVPPPARSSHRTDVSSASHRPTSSSPSSGATAASEGQAQRDPASDGPVVIGFITSASPRGARVYPGGTGYCCSASLWRARSLQHISRGAGGDACGEVMLGLQNGLHSTETVRVAVRVVLDTSARSDSWL